MLHLVTRSRRVAQSVIPFGVAIAAIGLAGCSETQQDPLAPTPPQSAVTAAASNTWTPKRAMPTARYGLVSGAVNNLVYAIGGIGNGGVFQRKVEAYNPATNTWTTKAQLPAVRAFVSGTAVINDRLYVVGGENGNGETKSLYVYNPSTNSWSSKAPIPITSANGVVGAINGKIYLYTPTIPASLHRYDPATNTWSQPLATPPNSLFQPAGGVINGKLYVAGGLEQGASASIRAILLEYNPATNSWRPRAFMPTARQAAAGRVINNKLYVVGGINTSNTVIPNVEVYNPATNTWAIKANMPTSRFSLGAGAVNGLLYAVGGFTNTGVVATNEAYTP